MHSVVGLFGGWRDAVAAWFHLSRAGFRWRDVRVCPYDRYLHERLHPTIAHLRSLHEYACLSGGGLFGTCSGLLLGLFAAGVEPGGTFLLAATGMVLGAAAGYGIGRYDPMQIPLATSHEPTAHWGGGRILVRVVAPSTRAADAQEALRRARAIQIFTCARGSPQL